MSRRDGSKTNNIPKKEKVHRKDGIEFFINKQKIEPTRFIAAVTDDFGYQVYGDFEEDTTYYLLMKLCAEKLAKSSNKKYALLGVLILQTLNTDVVDIFMKALKSNK